MNRQEVIDELKAADQIRALCSRCGGEFTLSEALLFDADSEWPDAALHVIRKRQDQLQKDNGHISEERTRLSQRKHNATDGLEKKSMEVCLGLAVEKLVTCWPQFPHAAHDCRKLSEPIDYVVFDGLTERQTVEQIAFVDVKSGNAELSTPQRRIREAVNEKRVTYEEI